jgi:hypothetical protein
MQRQYNFLQTLDLSDEVIIKLSLLLDKVNSGSSTVILSPYGTRLDPNTILSGWDKIYRSRLTEISSDLQFLEDSNRSKFGPRSVAIPWSEREEGVLDYFSPNNLQIDSNLDVSGPRRLRPLSADAALKFLKNDTNSGLPSYARKGSLKDDYLSNFKALLHRKDPCVMFTRTQEDKKTRTVWGFPMADTLNEMRFYRPLLDHQRKLNWRSSLNGPDIVDKRLTHIINSGIINNEQLVSIDFSAYDASVKTKLQDCAFGYIKNLFQSECVDELNYIQTRFNSIGLVTPVGIMNGPHGVPSGSTFTNEVDSIVQFLCAKSYGLESDCFDIQGDDGAYRAKDPDKLKDHFRSFGLKVNDSKSYVSNKTIVYLQNLYSTDYVRDNIICGIYPTYRALNRIIYQERFDDFNADDLIGADYYSIKTISILENCRNHPLFKDFVNYVATLDKFSLRYSQSGLLKYIQRYQTKHGIEGIFQYRYEDNLKGLNSFATVKLLSEL